jgi:hypothetical protein
VVKPILDPGNKAQTIGNQIVVLPNGDLVMLFNLIPTWVPTATGAIPLR